MLLRTVAERRVCTYMLFLCTRPPVVGQLVQERWTAAEGLQQEEKAFLVCWGAPQPCRVDGGDAICGGLV